MSDVLHCLGVGGLVQLGDGGAVDLVQKEDGGGDWLMVIFQQIVKEKLVGEHGARRSGVHEQEQAERAGGGA